MPSQSRGQLAAAVGRTHHVFDAPSAPADLEHADIALGQPTAEAILDAPSVRWAQIFTAGFTSFDRDHVREALRTRGTVITNSSVVYADACAQHALALMLASARQLAPAYRSQLTDHAWEQDQRRQLARVLSGDTVVLLGFGAIGERLAELLAPFHPRLYALRRHPRGNEPVEVIDEDALGRVLPLADHVVNLLPLNAGTEQFMNAGRLALMRAGATFYNIGRGATVDQAALLAILQTGRIQACLDVTHPEPLPFNHPLWSLPNCQITPHAAGGAQHELRRLMDHFLANLHRYERGEPLVNQVI
ncbi:MAG: D-2-hydroxyacid dehydrogenase [Opitutaceae bacterium]